eukprot:TRINITY_DN24993_c0_g1_i2.p1 TRINITY_DN24993_c0_g1~~TRINITY_DN24993_c0_g1_i2.p1  ORF type:complete len:155 (-),score=22.85 TRINITY_DN24993_c0_g1_i2:62-526(-)
MVELLSPHVEIFRIPSRLVRQTDLLLCAAKTQKIIALETDERVSPKEVGLALEKIKSAGNDKVVVVYSGESKGEVDFTNLLGLEELRLPIIVNLTRLQTRASKVRSIPNRHDFMGRVAKSTVAFTPVAGYEIITHNDIARSLYEPKSRLSLIHI